MSKPSLPFIDYAAVKSATNIHMVLAHYDLLEKLRPSGEDSLRGCCPIHKGSDDSQFSVTLSKSLWRCFSDCACGGNHLDLVMRLEDCTPHDAAWRMNEWFNLGNENASKSRAPAKGDRKEANSNKPHQPKSEKRADSSKPTAPVKTQAEPKVETGENKPLGFSLEGLDPKHLYLTERRLTEETIAEFGLGFCGKGVMAGRIAIPIHNLKGELVAYAGRWPGESPEGKEKYRLPGGFKKTLELFNAHRAFAEPAEQPLVIVEGYFDAMHLWQHGIRRVVALMGSHLSARQQECIAQHVTPTSRVLLMLDNDEAGKIATQQIAPHIAEYCFVRSFRWPDGIGQPDALTETPLADLRA